MTLDFLEYISNQHPKKILVVHHWDTDGLASAALILRYAQLHQWETSIELLCPQINNYFLTPAEIDSIRAAHHDAIVTVDLNFPLSTIEALESLNVPVFVFDHHAQTANIHRPGVQNVEYPGCSMLINDYLMMPLSLTAVLGAVGDQEERVAQRTAFYPQVEQMMKECTLTLAQMIHLTKLIDANYVFHDTQGMRRAVDLLIDGDASRIASEPDFVAALTKLSDEIMRVTALPVSEPKPRIKMLHIDSDASIISEVTRALSKRFPNDIIITDQSHKEQGNIYVRRASASVDLSFIADDARKRGYNAGGKSEVTGIILPTEDIAAYREWIINALPI